MSQIHIKESLFAVATVVTGLANGYFWRKFIYSENYADLRLIFPPLALMFLFAIFFSLLSLFSKNSYITFISAALSFSGGIFFIDGNNTVIIGTIIGITGSIFAAYKIRSDVNGILRFNLSKSLHRGLPFFFTVFALIISLTYFSSIIISERAFIPKPVFEVSANILQNYLGGLIPGFRPNATIDEVLTDVIAGELGGQLDINKIPKSQLKKLLDEQKSALNEKIGIKISGKEKTTELLYNLTNQKLEGLSGQYKIYLPYVSAIGFFLAIKTLTWPLYFVSLILVYFVVKLMLIAGLLKKEMTSTQTEKLTF